MTARRHSIGIDLGTSSLKAVLFDDAFRTIASSGCSLPTRSDHDGEATQDFEAVFRATKRALVALGRRAEAAGVGCIGITTHRSSLVAFDRDARRSLREMVLWNDRRATSWIRRHATRSLTRRIESLTGLPLLPYFFAPRIAALREFGDLPRGAMLLTPDAALLASLGANDPTTDATYAARTLLATREGRYEPRLLAAFGVVESELAPVAPSLGERGTSSCAGLPPALRGIPITAALADQSTACLGASGLRPDRDTLVFGTGLFAARAGSRDDPRRGVFPLVLATGRRRSLMGAEANDPSIGASFRLVRELLAAEDDDALETLARRSTNPALVVPAATGLGAPWLRPAARAAIFDLDSTSTRADVAAGVYAGVAARAAELLDLLKGRGRVRAAGGGAASDLLLQWVADRSGRTIERVSTSTIGALGVAACARIGAGESWAEIARKAAAATRPTARFTPNLRATTRDRLRVEFRRLVAAVATRRS